MTGVSAELCGAGMRSRFLPRPTKKSGRSGESGRKGGDEGTTEGKLLKLSETLDSDHVGDDLLGLLELVLGGQALGPFVERAQSNAVP